MIKFLLLITIFMLFFFGCSSKKNLNQRLNIGVELKSSFFMYSSISDTPKNETKDKEIKEK